jgi:hypothetical protein
VTGTALKLIEGGGTAQRQSRLTLPDFRQRGTSTEVPQTFSGSDWFTLDLWSDALLENALIPAGHGVSTFQINTRHASRLWSHTMAGCVDRLGRMADGWAGTDSKAPSSVAIRELQGLAPFLPLMTRTPEIEVEPSDGEIKLAWRATLVPRSIAIAFSGDSIARVLQANIEEPVDEPYLEIRLDASSMVDFAIGLSGLQNSDLFEVE